MQQMAHSLLGEFGEAVELERFAGTDSSGGYHSEQYHDPVTIQAVVRPGEIDVPFIDTTGQQGSQDAWLIVASEADVGEDDRITLSRGFGVDGFGEQQLGAGSTFEVSMPKECRHNGVAVYQLDEVDSRR